MNQKQLNILTLVVSLSLLAITAIAIIIAWPDSAPTTSNVTPPEAYDLIQDNADNHEFFIIDVRTAQEYAGGHIESAQNLDYNSEYFQEGILLLDKDATYLVYCKSGYRSAAASKAMMESGFSHVINMTVGYSNWVSGGFPVVR